jgi:hypothetical protein
MHRLPGGLKVVIAQPEHCCGIILPHIKALDGTGFLDDNPRHIHTDDMKKCSKPPNR